MPKRYAKNYNLPQLMCVVAAREVTDGELAFAGLGLPLLSLTLAKKLHAPRLKFVTEIGVVDWQPGAETRAPQSIGDEILHINSAMMGDMADILGCTLMGGRLDLAMLGGAQIDKYGNVNTNVIGNYSDFVIKLPGTGGNTDATCPAKRIIVIMPQEWRRFTERLDFLSSPGYIDGRGGRERHGLNPQGPNTVVSTMGIFRYNTSDGGKTGSCEMYLDAIFPNVELNAVKENVGWNLKISPDLKVVEPPTQEEIRVLDSLDPFGTFLVEGRYG